MSQATQQRTRRREPYLDPFAIRVDVEDSSVVVRVSGELDVATSPSLAAVLAGPAAGGTGAVVVDLSDVTFVDTRSVGVIAAAHERLGFCSVGLTRLRSSGTGGHGQEPDPHQSLTPRDGAPLRDREPELLNRGWFVQSGANAAGAA